jgi:DNA (cytosine-5)-methyltransferase 1
VLSHKEYSDEPLAVDLFSGAGGLSLGLQRAGFRLALAVDHNEFAVETHAAYFPGASVAADISNETALDELLAPLRGRRIDLLAGSPPCQPFSKTTRWIRSVQLSGFGSMRDHRRELWCSFLYATELLKPRAVLIENVTDIATNEDGIILRAIFARLEQLEYSIDCRTFFAFDFGAPQVRNRIFIVAFRRSNKLLEWPVTVIESKRPTLRDAIFDLPPLRGGWKEKTPQYAGPLTPLQRSFREGFEDGDLALFDHITRAVREDDLRAFQHLGEKTKYYELPEELRRYGADSFVDKYNRLSWDEPCRSIIAHMGKDGYWYIHPDQHRSLSIREAARVQSFPDWFRFAGFRTSAFRQIGEAVAPFVGEAIGTSIREYLERPDRNRRSNKRAAGFGKNLLIRKSLKEWYEKEARKNSLHPWRLQADLWTNVMGEMLFADRSRRPKALLFWENYLRDWADPRSFLKDKHREMHLRTIGLSARLPVLESLARYLRLTKNPTLRGLIAAGVSERLARRAMAVSGCSFERPNDTALIRVASRVFERTVSRGNGVDSQISTAMLVGEDEGAKLYAAAIELGEAICSASDPACLLCPLSSFCLHYAIQKSLPRSKSKPSFKTVRSALSS